MIDVCCLCGNEGEALGPPPHVHLSCVLEGPKPLVVEPERAHKRKAWFPQKALVAPDLKVVDGAIMLAIGNIRRASGGSGPHLKHFLVDDSTGYCGVRGRAKTRRTSPRFKAEVIIRLRDIPDLTRESLKPKLGFGTLCSRCLEIVKAQAEVALAGESSSKHLEASSIGHTAPPAPAPHEAET